MGDKLFQEIPNILELLTAIEFYNNLLIDFAIENVIVDVISSYKHMLAESFGRKFLNFYYSGYL